MINLDADDELIGKNVLKIFNAAHQKYRAGVIYSNFYWYDQRGRAQVGFTSEYTDEEKRNNAFREVNQKFSHLKSFKAELFLQIKEQDFKDSDGLYWTSAGDMAIYFPLL